jgi:tRNA threonylcarbamoyladenosine biosynthesis protein TsaB
MKNFILYIDTSESKATTVELRDANGNVVRKMTAAIARAQTALPLIKQLLAEEKKTLEDIVEIQVHPGPGSFTGLRVGAAIGSMLAALLQVPLNGKTPGSSIDPVYADGGKFS